MSPDDGEDLTWLLQRAVDSSSRAQTIVEVTAFAATSFGTAHVGVTLLHSHGRRFEGAGPTTDLVRQADQLQGDLLEGPCVDAATRWRTVVSDDLGTDDRWPTWGPLAAALGLGSVLSSEIHAGGRRAGALNIYGESHREFSLEEVELAHVLASQAAVALQFADKLEGLIAALDSRTMIGQAQGILMNQYRVDAGRAFAILKRLSQERNIRLAAVAQRIVDDAIMR